MDEWLRYGLDSYLPRARWWPFKGGKAGVEIVEKADYGELVVLLLRSNNLLFHLPLMRVDKIPAGLESRGFCLNSECFVEAEYTPKYFKLLGSIGEASIEYLDPSYDLSSVVSAEPLTLESTNSVVRYDLPDKARIVIKSYRLIPLINLEASILRKLVEEKYRHIPEIIAFVKYRNTVTGVVSKFIKGAGDGGYPFYEALLEYLSGKSNGLRIGLASKLGIVISDLHNALNRGGNGLFGAETTFSSDIEKWRLRIERMYSESMKRLDEAISRGNERLTYWRDILEEKYELIETAVSMLDMFNGLPKARTHQDLHLGQMIYVDKPVEDFVITDFEGEPGRSDEERLMKEPLLRDVASMIRSFHYLSHAGIMNYMGKSQDEVSRIMIERDPSINWRLTHVRAMVYSYIMNIDAARLLGVSREHLVRDFPRILYPWIIERAVYEIYYESLYRPEWVSIPISGLFEAEHVYRVS